MKLVSVVAATATANAGTKALDMQPDAGNSSAKPPADPLVRDPYPETTGSGNEPLLIL